MKLIVCIDKKNGLTFNKRRVSRDAMMLQNVIALIEDKKCFASVFSQMLLESDKSRFTITDNYLEQAGEGDFCFYETGKIAPYVEKISDIYLYNWNREYPADEFFMLPKGFRLCESVDFVGKSHEKISRLHYVKEK